MHRIPLTAALLSAAVALATVAPFMAARADEPTSPPASAKAPAPALNFTVKDIDGKDVPLATYQGHVILIVNVASKCGNTPQYAALEKLYQKYQPQGLVVLGFPANNFGGQEPGTAQQIKDFCTSTYHVTFPMFSKISVKGDDIAPLYHHLTRLQTAPQPAGDITWNFEKFLIARDGTVVARFKPGTKPDDPTIVKAIETELAKPKP